MLNLKQENSCIKICFKRIFAIFSNVICIIISSFKNSYSKEHLIKNIICNSLKYIKLSTADDEDIRSGKNILKKIKIKLVF